MSQGAWTNRLRAVGPGASGLDQPSAIGFLLCQDTFANVVVGFLVMGPGSDLSEVLVWGCEPAALDFSVAPRCPPGPVALAVT